ncbi:MAG: GerMN domain-containing protein [Candidatus Staskawiczbacteria bacterium]|nr:GerMN domain-containing protein [Candidatus Staskawiczbacteria bacterium]MBI3337047.1 GerMN domain-containing protein [Candidatus Staskawiczbacteria bacterium]
MKKVFLIILILSIIVLAIGAFTFWQQNNEETPPSEIKSGIEVFLPKLDEEVSSPLEIKGTVNGLGWIGFEGQVGTVKLLDSEGKELAATYLKATTDWMQPSVRFETTLDFISLNAGEGKLVFNNENPSDLPQFNRQFILPVKIAKTVEGTIQVKLYFNNNIMDPEYACQKVFPVDRGVSETKAVARAALDELLKGPTKQEILDGFFTSISPDVKIQKLTIENTVAKVDFDSNLEKNVGGSCRVTAIRNQITQTLLQFKTIKSVIISIDGRTEDILQP